MKTVLHKAATRGHLNFDWLDANYSFSFGQYHDASRIHFGALRVLNDDIIKGGMGFGTHPHDNMEIVTIPLDGALEHKDSTGGHGVIQKYDVQVMSAGSGIKHSEFNHSETAAANTLQIWVFPKKKDIAPRYDQKTYLPQDRVNKFQTVVAPDDANALWVNQDTWFSLGDIKKDETVQYDFHQKGSGVYAFVIEGDVTINGTALNKRDGLGISETEHLDIKASSNAEVLLIEVPLHFN
jgi:redox-sensitive bicupin YhaK (pirin superfamily)